MFAGIASNGQHDEAQEDLVKPTGRTDLLNGTCQISAAEQQGLSPLSSIVLPPRHLIGADGRCSGNEYQHPKDGTVGTKPLRPGAAHSI